MLVAGHGPHQSSSCATLHGMDLAPGTLIVDGRYRVEGVLGRGGMAVVYRIRSQQSNLCLALKVMGMYNTVGRQRLLREGMLQGGLRHPNIVCVHDFIEIGQQPALILELINGPDLNTVLKTHHFTHAQSDAVARQVLRGIKTAHAQGLVHRDLKPGNILLSLEPPSVVPKIADFGLVKRLHQDSYSTTRTGTMLGTPAYMSPEHIKDVGRVDVRGDIFSLGAILYELVTGHRCFRGESLFEIQEAIVYGKLIPPRERVQLPDRMNEAILAALQVDPADRPQTVGALLELWTGGQPDPDPESTWSTEHFAQFQASSVAMDDTLSHDDWEVLYRSTLNNKTMDLSDEGSVDSPAPEASQPSSEATETPEAAPEVPSAVPSEPLGKEFAAALLTVFSITVGLSVFFSMRQVGPNVVPVSSEPSSALSTPATSRDGAPIVFLETTLPTTLNPLFAQTMSDVRAQTLVFDRLFYWGAEDNALSSHLLEDWSYQPELRLVHLRLRDGVFWHDGAPLTGEDICFTHQAMQQSPDNPMRSQYASNILRCTVLDERVVELELVREFISPYTRLSWPVLPSHVFDSPRIEPSHPFSQRPIGTGAMMAERHDSGVSFVQHPYEDNGASIQALELRVETDPVEQLRLLQSNEADGLIEYYGTLPGSDGLRPMRYDTRAWMFIALNQTTEVLEDQRMRAALDAYLDRPALRAGLIQSGGFSEMIQNFISGPFCVSSPHYGRSTPVPRHDPVQASDWMRAQGAVMSDGRWLQDGAPIVLRLGVLEHVQQAMPHLGRLIAEQLQSAGFVIEVSTVSATDWHERVIKGLALDDMELLVGSWAIGDNEEVSELFHSRFRGQGSRNLFAYTNREVDQLLQEIDLAEDAQTEQEHYAALHQELAEERPYLYLWDTTAATIWSSQVSHAAIAPYYYFTEFRSWSLKTGPADEQP